VAIGVISGKYYSYDGTTIIFYTCIGIGGEHSEPTRPSATRAALVSRIRSDIQNGGADVISEITLGPTEAAILVLEGMITSENLQEATESDEVIVVPDVVFTNFGAYTHTFRIKKDFIGFATKATLAF
jgi:hypothetical protein